MTLRISEAEGARYQQDLRRFLENTALHLRTLAASSDTAEMWEETRKTATMMLKACPAGEPRNDT